MIAARSTRSEVTIPRTASKHYAGRRIGRYRIESLLAATGMSDVYRAIDPETGELVALKLLHVPGPFAADAAVRFRREVAAHRIDHPGIVPALDTGDHHGQPYLVMPLLAGTLEASRVGYRTPERAVRLVQQVATALAAAHAAGVVHRDIKPANILIDREGRALLADFGLARWTAWADRVTATGERVGTAAYAAPEKTAEPAADIWSLGVILYELLSGRHPFDDVPLDGVPPPLRKSLPSVPVDLDRIVGRCLQPHPGDRYPSAAALADDLARFQAGVPVETVPARPSVVGPSRIAALALVAMLAICLIVLLAPAQASVGSIDWTSWQPSSQKRQWLQGRLAGGKPIDLLVDGVPRDGSWQTDRTGTADHSQGAIVLTSPHSYSYYSLCTAPPTRFEFTATIRVVESWPAPTLGVFWAGVNTPTPRGMQFDAMALMYLKKANNPTYIERLHNHCRNPVWHSAVVMGSLTPSVNGQLYHMPPMPGTMQQAHTITVRSDGQRCRMIFDGQMLGEFVVSQMQDYRNPPPFQLPYDTVPVLSPSFDGSIGLMFGEATIEVSTIQLRQLAANEIP